MPDAGPAAESDDDDGEWEPSIVETVAKTGEGVEELLETLADHVEWLSESGELETQARKRYRAEIQTLLREDTAALLEEEIDARGGLDAYVDRVIEKETDPYSVADELIAPIEACVRDRRER
jgi:LAO/AO transport system kinase